MRPSLVSNCKGWGKWGLQGIENELESMYSLSAWLCLEINPRYGAPSEIRTRCR